MSQHILEWLPAYHDGELSPTRRQGVEQHLQECPACRAELQTLEGLSALLKADPAPENTPPERFAAQVQLRLPRQYPARSRLSTQQLPRWVLAAPLAIIVVWAFLQASLWVTSLLMASGWIVGSAPFTAWLAPDSALDLFGTLSVLNIALLAGAGILWAAWMAFWWTWKKNENMQVSLQPLQHLEKEY
jgi:anti-sigma factor RsiW